MLKEHFSNLILRKINSKIDIFNYPFKNYTSIEKNFYSYPNNKNIKLVEIKFFASNAKLIAILDLEIEINSLKFNEGNFNMFITIYSTNFKGKNYYYYSNHDFSVLSNVKTLEENLIELPTINLLLSEIEQVICL